MIYLCLTFIFKILKLINLGIHNKKIKHFLYVSDSKSKINYLHISKIIDNYHFVQILCLKMEYTFIFPFFSK